jgi:hypothetical protein
MAETASFSSISGDASVNNDEDLEIIDTDNIPSSFFTKNDAETITIDGKTYIQVEKEATKRRGTTSWIWNFGVELREMTSGEYKRCWRCTLCPSNRNSVYTIDSTTHNAIKHLKSHRI